MTERRANPPIIKSKSVDSRRIAGHAALSVTDGRLMAQAAGDVLAYAAEAAFRKDGSARETADAAIALAKRVAERRWLDGDLAYREELFNELAAERDADTEEHNILFGRGHRGPDPTTHYITDTAYWVTHLLKIPMKSVGLPEMWFRDSTTTLEEMLRYASIIAWLVGENGAAVRVFVASINGGLRDADGATPAPKRQRTAARGPRRRA